MSKFEHEDDIKSINEKLKQIKEEQKCPHRFINSFFKRNQIEYDPLNEMFINKDGQSLNFDKIHAELLIQGSAKGLSKDLIFAALDVYTIESSERLLNETKQAINFKGENPFIWRALQDATNLSRLDLIVIKHWIRNVKLKLNRQPADHHMMPILVGPQGAGKTRFIQRFLEPLSGLTNFSGRFTLYNDGRELFNLAKSYVIVLDELANATQSDLNCIKNAISSNTVSYRKLGYNKQITAFNCHSPIGASNEPLNETLVDFTGLRRFWQINWQTPKFEAVNKLDVLAIWQSVDPRVDYITPHLNEIKAVQEALRPKSSIELFISCSVAAGAGWVLGEQLYTAFIDFCAVEGVTPTSRRAFYNSLQSLKSKKTKAGLAFECSLITALSKAA